MNWTLTFTQDQITLNLLPAAKRGIGRLLGAARADAAPDLRTISDPAFAMALGELKGVADELGLPITLTSNAITMPHAVAASLSSEAAQLLGLPSLLDLTLQTDVKGLVGSSNFALTYAWFDKGVRQMATRSGCLLETAKGLRRLPLWVMRALDVADAVSDTTEDSHWEKLARFRQALAPAVSDQENDTTSVELSRFLRGLQIHITDCFSIAAVQHKDDTAFDIIPFSREKLLDLEEGGTSISEKDSELPPQQLENFQRRVRTKGSLPSYKVGDKQYLVVDSRAQPVLSLMADKQKASPAVRQAFIKNPWPAISEVIEADLEKKGLLDNLNDEQRVQEIDRYLSPVFVETREYSARVLGLGRYVAPVTPWADSGNTTDWLPEIIPESTRQRLAELPPERLPALAQALEAALKQGEPELSFDGQNYPVSEMLLEALTGFINRGQLSPEAEGGPVETDAEGASDTAAGDAGASDDVSDDSSGPFVLQSRENFEDLNWQPPIQPRGVGLNLQPHALASLAVPTGIVTPLKPHQEKGFQIMAQSWLSGMPGILNADEQGLGKTLETLAFLRWLKDLDLVQDQGTVAGMAKEEIPNGVGGQRAFEATQSADGQGSIDAAQNALIRPGQDGAIPSTSDPSRLVNATESDDGRSGLEGATESDDGKQGLVGKAQRDTDTQELAKEVQGSSASLGSVEETHNRASGLGPVLVVAPTSLLENWANEVSQHCDTVGLGQLLRLYGTNLARYKKPDAAAVETQSGIEQLDLEHLQTAIAEGKGGRFWLLTTYTTLRNYHLSFARIGFSAVVFDEIQALKNPYSLTSVAARAVNADYRIGLTGTPIENALEDLWAITDQLTPGYMGTLKEFSSTYAEPEQALMQNLHRKVFQAHDSPAPLGFRRMKEEVAADLPAKLRYLYPRIMPRVQAAAYDSVRTTLNRSSPGAALKILQHIRGVSVHPAFDAAANYDDFIGVSARLSACFDILQEIKQKQECALVFIENRKMQHQFIELAKQAFKLPRIDLINGNTPIAERAAIVERFQTNLNGPKQFAILVLSPKAAGAGLTLTAATHIIHLSRWWNPAVEEQCNDRAHRIGQTQDVNIHIPMAIHSAYQDKSFDCLLHELMTKKRHLAQATLWPSARDDDIVAGLRAGLMATPTSATTHQHDLVNTVMQKLSENTGERIRLERGRYEVLG